jgi:hypothetical protein
LPHVGEEDVRVLAEEGDVPLLDDAGDDLVDERRLAAALLAVEQVSAAVEEAVPAELLALAPELADLGDDAGGQAVGEVDEVIDVEGAGLELGVAEMVHRGRVGPWGQARRGGPARLEDPAGVDRPLPPLPGGDARLVKFHDCAPWLRREGALRGRTRGRTEGV